MYSDEKNIGSQAYKHIPSAPCWTHASGLITSNHQVGPSIMKIAAIMWGLSSLRSHHMNLMPP